MGYYRDNVYYDTLYKEGGIYDGKIEDSPYYNLWTEVIYLIPTGKILELGCGVGQFAKMLCDDIIRHPRYAGVDFSEVAIKKAKAKKLPYEFFHMDITKEAFDCDFLLCMETLEHLKDPHQVLRMYQGKDCLITVPNFDDHAHVYHYNNMRNVTLHYEPVIDIELLRLIDKKWFLIKGKIKEL